MQKDTICHLNEKIHGTSCPNGGNFPVSHLQSNGGNQVCSNPSCPYQVARVKGSVYVVVVGKSGEAGQTIVMKA